MELVYLNGDKDQSIAGRIRIHSQSPNTINIIGNSFQAKRVLYVTIHNDLEIKELFFDYNQAQPPVMSMPEFYDMLVNTAEKISWMNEYIIESQIDSDNCNASTSLIKIGLKSDVTCDSLLERKFGITLEPVICSENIQNEDVVATKLGYYVGKVGVPEKRGEPAEIKICLEINPCEAIKKLFIAIANEQINHALQD